MCNCREVRGVLVLGVAIAQCYVGDASNSFIQSTCQGVTIHGGSVAVRDAVISFADSVAKSLEAGEKNGEGQSFAGLLAHIMKTAADGGVDDSGLAKAHVVTVQVGANDGKQNDPFHKALVLGKSVTRHMLVSWVPIMFEPAPRMFEKLTHHWGILSKVKSSACHIAARRPVAYPSESICPFYSFNTSAIDGDSKICSRCTRCEDHSRFMKEQLGSLDEETMRNFFAPNFERCIAAEKLPCGPLKTALDWLEWAPGVERRIDVLHIDAEGFDGNIIHGLLDDEDEVSPLAIFFEAKVMRHSIRKPSKTPYSCALMDLFERLSADGRVIVYNGGEDALAIKSSAAPVRPWQKRDPDRCSAKLMHDYPKSWGAMKDALYPSKEDKIKIWNSLTECCDTVYRIPFDFESRIVE